VPKIWTSGVIAYLLLHASGAAAQQMAQADINQLSIEQLGQVEITSVSRRPERLDQAPAAIFVITAEDIRRSGATTLPEALRLAPNLEVARVNGYDYAVSARGFNSAEAANKLLVLVDGRSVYSPLASTVFWENVDVPLDNVARIEVVSGPGGTLYGANAVNGVINIITKNAADTQNGYVHATAGTLQDQALLRYGFSPWDGASLALHGQVEHTNATPFLHPAGAAPHDWTRAQGGFRFDQNGEKNDFTVEGSLFDNQSLNAGLEKARGGDLNGIWTHRWDDGSVLTGQLSADDSSRILSSPHDREDLRTFDLQLQQTTSLGFGDALVVGGEYRDWRESYFAGGIFGFAMPTTTIDLINLFAEDQFNLAPRLRATLGLKLEHNSYSGLDALPDFRLAWQLNDSDMVWAAVSRAVRTPSKIDRELESPGILLPSPHFASESLVAYELGWRSNPLPNLSFSLSAYYNVYGSLRSDQATPVTILPITLENGTKGNVYGLEAWSKYGLTDWWRLDAGLSWLHKDFVSLPGHPDFAQGQSEGQDPAAQAQLRSHMDLPGDFELDAGLRAVGKVTQEIPAGSRSPTLPPQLSLVPGYVEADARIGWNLGDRTEIELGGFNLLHSRHLEVNDPSTYTPHEIPRYFAVGLRQRF
jgi:iron complex outermembrane receptor protein